jgi:hypothetical protein
MRVSLVVLIVLSAAVIVLFWRDRVTTAQRRDARERQITALCREVVQLREGIVAAFIAAGQDPTDEGFQAGVSELRRLVTCDPLEG